VLVSKLLMTRFDRGAELWKMPCRRSEVQHIRVMMSASRLWQLVHV
jgi:hypothetical protein